MEINTFTKNLIFLLIVLGCLEGCGHKETPLPEPGPETILRHSGSLYTSLAFYVGTKLDVFTVLDPKPLTVEEASQMMNIKPRFLERLFYSLAAADMVHVKDGVFSNTEEASRYLVVGKPEYMGEHVLVNPFLKQWMVHAGTIMEDTLRKGEAAEKFDYSGMAFEDLLSAFRGTMPVAVKAGEELVRRYDFSVYRTIADVGGASGGLVASLSKAYPHLQAAVTDLPSVTPVARALLQEQGLSEIDIIEWDVLEGPCRQTFDAVILRALLQVLSPEQAAQAVMNIGKSVNPGGAVYILGHMMDDSKTSPPSEVVWFLLNLNWEDHAGFYTEGDYRKMLLDAGFQDIKSDVLPNGDQVIEARKPTL
jgi:8-O-methyltransferase